MAGIGFRLQKLLRSEDVFSKLGGVIASVFLSSGPWICTILSIGAISLVSSGRVDPTERYVFRILVNYTYAASLIGFGVLEMVTTRYIADALYLRQEKVLPTLYCQLAVVILAISTIVGSIFYYFSGLGWEYGVLGTMLLAVVSLIWCAMIFLTACKDYGRITGCFLGGMGISVVGVYLLTNVAYMEMKGLLMGFTFGQVFIAVMLSYFILREFGTGYLVPRDFFEHLGRKKIFVFIGLTYALAIWVDKLCFWFSPATGEKVGPLFYKCSAYDSGVFLSYLFIVPSMAYFLVKMETEFYHSYQRFFALIDNRAPRTLVERSRNEMINVLRDDIGGLLLFQSFVSIPALVFAPHIVELFGLPVVYTTVFRYGLIAAYLHVFMLITNIVILYFDLSRVVLRNYLMLLVLNFAFSFGSTFLDYRFHGLGYLLAAFVGFVASVLSLSQALKKLNFYIFMKQPLAKPSYLPLELEWVTLK